MSNAIARRIEELEKMSPPLTAMPDLEDYWTRTLKHFETKPLHGSRTRVDTPMKFAEVFRVEFEGFDDTRISGWYMLPRFQEDVGSDRKRPCVVLFHGYMGGKGMPEDYGSYLLMGMAVLAVDVRGQGGETGNRLPQEYGMTKGWITQGILDRDTCYYKAITIDALKAIEFAARQDEIDPSRIAIHGISQGGGLVLLAAALSDIPAVAIAHIPNMCQMDYGILNSNSSLSEAAEFAAKRPELLGKVLETLSYFDNLNMACRIRVPVLVTCGLKDTITMPETIFAAYNRIAAPKRIEVSPFTGHAVTGHLNRLAMEFLNNHLL
ncbi:acetylxylan esterase [Cohnella faecalis]|uniref:Alpha/beta fold hydrolase n=1 Tax=Cohnella faecalis TaxID=2315694 RepID=A0A398CWX2_9BACL|nr:alpha/beta fold hydrolase [Cohnella faecalis]RIE03701.1 alpha/beta fold hydrolase [Cohnella faecalis]